MRRLFFLILSFLCLLLGLFFFLFIHFFISVFLSLDFFIPCLCYVPNVWLLISFCLRLNLEVRNGTIFHAARFVNLPLGGRRVVLWTVQTRQAKKVVLKRGNVLVLKESLSLLQVHQNLFHWTCFCWHQHWQNHKMKNRAGNQLTLNLWTS